MSTGHRDGLGSCLMNKPFRKRTVLGCVLVHFVCFCFIHRHVDDVDLFTGGVAERAVDDGLVGPTFACLLGTQFNFLRNGDRFFYLNREGPQIFTRGMGI